MACKSDGKVNLRRKNSKTKPKGKGKLTKDKKKKKDCSVWKSQSFPHPLIFGDMSQCRWFWQNYYSAFQWQERHQVAYWKSRSIALEYENQILYQQLRSISFSDGQYRLPSLSQNADLTHSEVPPSQSSNFSVQENVTNKSPSFHDNEDLEEDDNCYEEAESEYQLSEEMIEFFKKNMEHKLELKKQREKEEEEEAQKEPAFEGIYMPPREQLGAKRLREMQLMYGQDAPMIMGMETAMQLSFDRNRDLNQAKLWPNIPLKL